ncbi:hypothetical protein H2201_003278 [Coniosporium apollinis]|uniref:Uncharacterized protein n=2 Tax=Coniosporium TaxID=2810619 RepID=A0ABQ9NZB1_9PEZI|nr:hypothetical protein H2199_008674 [Cladosporium sp. JES 115]KAJ9666619.1 hypothetical protein H2201_003278 [Coniosporium apollinis]
MSSDEHNQDGTIMPPATLNGYDNDNSVQLSQIMDMLRQIQEAQRDMAKRVKKVETTLAKVKKHLKSKTSRDDSRSKKRKRNDDADMDDLVLERMSTPARMQMAEEQMAGLRPDITCPDCYSYDVKGECFRSGDFGWCIRHESPAEQKFGVFPHCIQREAGEINHCVIAYHDHEEDNS